VGRRRLARGRAGGGEVVPPARSARARVATGAAAGALAAALGGWLAVGADDRAARWACAAGAAGALVLLAAGLTLRRPVAVPLALLSLGGGYGALLAVQGPALDGRAPVVAAGLFLVGELAYWSLELREAVADEPGAHVRRLALLATLALGALAVGAGLLAVVDAGEREGLALETLGVVAAVAALAVVALAGRERGRS
jgi:hypothetical protein